MTHEPGPLLEGEALVRLGAAPRADQGAFRGGLAKRLGRTRVNGSTP